MAEPGVDELEERLAHDFARLGFRAAAHRLRSQTGADDASPEEESAGDASSLEVAAQLERVQERLDTIVRRLDWIDAALADRSGQAVLDRLARLEDLLVKVAATSPADPEAGGAGSRQLIERIDALGELLIDAEPHRDGQTIEHLRVQERQLADLSARIEELQRRLGV